MTSSVPQAEAFGASPAEHAKAVRARIEKLAHLPAAAAVAVKLMHLGHDEKAGLRDYAQIVRADAGLSGKMLSAVNAASAGVGSQVTNVETAVKLLGPPVVRVLAISNCLAGLQSDLGLTQEEAQLFWLGSLRSAIVARTWTARHAAKLADDAFAAGLFQNIAAPIMYVTAKDTVRPMLEEHGREPQRLLQHERLAFRTDHQELGRLITTRIGLPETLVEAVARHHNRAALQEVLASAALADGTYAASLCPHDMASAAEGVQGCRETFAKHGEGFFEDLASFIEEAHVEFTQTVSLFSGALDADLDSNALIQEGTAMLAESTFGLAGEICRLRREADDRSDTIQQLQANESQLRREAEHDPLTGALNRGGFEKHGRARMSSAVRTGSPFGLVYLDLDDFKSVNDHYGHEAGDEALKLVAGTIRDAVRKDDLVARVGGDEFAVLLFDCRLDDARRLADEFHRRFQTQVRDQKHLGAVTLSMGLVWVPAGGEPPGLAMLISAADKLMYRSKRAGGNRLEYCTL